ncbi:50S ribosomal protein L25 [Oceanivirga salmonicida]|uniref:50S ribosomal protein L25 n=1 Tax=Oceanivirga salmonicida TaxID=1769291 RepID=UPI00082F026A|nr:50S ribosomal protein L25 [Oceanivirga salmonicida]
MVKEKVLKAQKRAEFGSKATKRARKDGFTPVVLYGKDFESTGLLIKTDELKHYINNSELGAMISIDIEGKKETVLVKDVQRQTLTGKILHVDFQHVKFGEKIKVTLPIHFINEDKIKSDFIVQKVLDYLDVEAFPKNLVDFIEIDIQDLKMGEPITVNDIDTKKYKGIEFLSEKDTTIVLLIEPSKHEEVEVVADENEETENSETEEAE